MNMIKNYHWDKNKTRLNLVKQSSSGKFNWFFIPGGAGMDSSYLHPLIHANEYPGNCWAVDFPGNGDNLVTTENDFLKWKTYLLDIICHYENPIIVAHSFGGMLTLMEPQLESYLKGLILINTSPRDWSDTREQVISKKQLPKLKDAYQKFRQTNTNTMYHDFIKTCLPHLFSHDMREKGFQMYASLPYNFDAYEWWIIKGPEIYDAYWVPDKLPTLILCGGEDYVTPPQLFTKDKRFHRDNIQLLELPGASHFCWFEKMPCIQKYIRVYIDTLKN